MSLDHVNHLQEGLPAGHYCCETCHNPTPDIYVDCHGRVLCGECVEIDAALRTYRYQELREQIRHQRVLARELPSLRPCYPDKYCPAPDFAELGEFEWEARHGEG